MKENIFNYEGEEKQLSLSSVKDNKSSSEHIKMKERKPKVKFENVNIPKITMSTKKTFGEQVFEQKNPPEIFERRKKKFHTLLTKNTKLFQNNTLKKKKRKKGKHKTIDIQTKKEDLYSEKEKISKSKKESNNQIEENEDEKEEFEDKEVKTKLEVVLEKKFTPTQTLLNYCKCQIYISYDNMTGFQYTGLEGILCIMINRLLSNLYLQVYDIMDFKKQFEIELYKYFVK